jgi:polyisoprenoid-binding protein YceI
MERNVDVPHSGIDFRVKHFFTPVPGSFEELTLDRRDFDAGVGSWAATAVVGKEVEVRVAVEANR